MVWLITAATPIDAISRSAKIQVSRPPTVSSATSRRRSRRLRRGIRARRPGWRWPASTSAAVATAAASARSPGLRPVTGGGCGTGVPNWSASAIPSIASRIPGATRMPSCTAVTAASVSEWVRLSSAAIRTSPGSRPLVRARREARSSQAAFSAVTTCWCARANSGVPAARSARAMVR